MRVQIPLAPYYPLRTYIEKEDPRIAQRLRKHSKSINISLAFILVWVDEIQMG
jgi:hypothetical protein